MKFAALLLIASAFSRVPVCSAQDVTVLLLNARNGHPLANETVSVQFHVPQVADLRVFEAKTGADGTTTLHFPQPIPQAISVFPVNPKFYLCSDLLPFDTHQVIAEGLVSRCCKPTQQCRCKFGKQVLRLHGRPGELVLLARPMPWLERFINNFDLWSQGSTTGIILGENSSAERNIERSVCWPMDV